MADLHTITLNSGRVLAFAEYGDADSDNVLMYFHGWPSSRLQGALLDKTGKKLRVRIIATDRPGIGRSEAQPGRTLLDWPTVVVELADQLGIDKFFIYAVSGGGPYALATAYAAPHRVNGVTVLCGAPPLNEVGTRQMMWPYRVAMVIRKHAPVLLDHSLRLAERISHQSANGLILRKLIAGLDREDQRALSLDDNMAVMTRSFQESLNSDVSAVRADGDLYSEKWGFDPAEITVPLMFSHGALDKNIPVEMTRPYISRIPGTELTVYPDDGHYALPLLRSEEIIQKLLKTPLSTAATV